MIVKKMEIILQTITAWWHKNEAYIECIEVIQGIRIILAGLKSNTDEVGLCLILHADLSLPVSNECLLVLSNYTDILVLILYYMNEFYAAGLVEVWIRYSNVMYSRYIPIHTMYPKLGTRFSLK